VYVADVVPVEIRRRRSPPRRRCRLRVREEAGLHERRGGLRARVMAPAKRVDQCIIRREPRSECSDKGLAQRIRQQGAPETGGPGAKAEDCRGDTTSRRRARLTRRGPPQQTPRRTGNRAFAREPQKSSRREARADEERRGEVGPGVSGAAEVADAGLCSRDLGPYVRDQKPAVT